MANFQKITDHLASFPEDALRKGKAFERSCKWFLENDPGYTAQLKQVWLWENWPGNWGRDKGIDLIAETHDGKIWAIQAKAYDENISSISKSDIDKFLSESSRKLIDFRLLIATTNTIGANAREVMDGQEKPISLCLLDNLEASPLDWSLYFNDSKAPLTKERFAPRPHQEKALTDIISGFDQSSRGQLHMACGTGKTLVGLWLTERLQSNTTLVLVPSISLVAQLYREWSKNNSEHFKFYPLFICSDVTVNRKDDDDDRYVVHSADLGFPVTTNAHDIIDTLSRISQPKVIFATYHSSPVLKEACELDSSLMFDLVIADEAHRCAGRANSDFATITHTDAIRTKRLLFMTATPRFFTNRVKKIAQESEYEIISMDDHDTFGPVFHTLLFSDAIKNGLLTDYQVVISIIDNKTYQEYAERGRFVAINDHETDARTLASQIMVAKAIKKHDLTRLISFHSRNKSAQEFVNSFPKALSLIHETERPIIHFKGTINGDMPQADRSKILKDFTKPAPEGAALLANVRCLSEGVDVPTLDGIVFIDPKGSETDIIQAVGRAIRKADDKHIGTILIPIFVDNVTDEAVALEQSCFKTVWQVIKALRAHDNILAEELDSIRLELGKRTYKSPPKLTKITFDLPVSIGVEFGEALEVKLIRNITEYCSSTWNYQFACLKEFRDLNPNKWPNYKEEFPKGNNIYEWCIGQRKSYRDKKLSTEKINLLNDIGFAWNVFDERWDQQFEYLKEFRLHNPDRWPGKTEEFPQNNKLGVWYGAQQHRYKTGLLSPYRMKALESIGFIGDVFNSRWDMQYNHLKEYRILFPNKWPVANEEFPEGNNLGNWCSDQRNNLKNGCLNADRKKLLDELKFLWNPLIDEWQQQFACLQEFRRQNPDRWPKIKEYFPEGNDLGRWCSIQRDAYKNQKINDEKISLLNSIGFIWNLFDWQWNKQLEYLKEFRNQNPDRWPRKKEQFPEGNDINEWCVDQRQKYKNGKLSDEQINKLEELGFVLDTIDKAWDKKWDIQFNNLCEFRKLFPGRWPSDKEEFPEGNKLGSWCSDQRKKYRQGKLASEKQEKLKLISFL